MELSGRCHSAGCIQPRAPLSIFCDAHHEEQLKRAGLWVDRAPEECSKRLATHCEMILRAFRREALTRDECLCQLFDRLVYFGTRESSDCWGPALESLPADVARDLLQYARVHPQPRMFGESFVTTDGRAAAERVTLAVQAELIERLEGALRRAE